MNAPDSDPRDRTSNTTNDTSRPFTIEDVVAWFGSSGVIDAAIRRGEMIPDFELANMAGRTVSVQTLLDRGPVVICFTLGRHSPPCRRSLRDLQAGLSGIAARGASLVAITPDVPAASDSLRAQQGLGFDLLADETGHLAALFGLAYAPPIATPVWLALLEHERPAEWPRLDLLLPAAYVVTPDGIAQMAFVPADPLLRISCAQVLAALSALPAPAGSTGG